MNTYFSLFLSTGGYKEYQDRRDEALGEYNELPDLGPMKKKVLHKFLEDNQPTEMAIMMSDQVWEHNRRYYTFFWCLHQYDGREFARAC